jgi:hypothetical protein
MDGAKFDRLARALSTILTRRRAMVNIGAVAAMMGQRVVRGAQLTTATCGEEGAVCTLTFGCCDGLTCVTSAINTSYGICVPGDGGMVSTGSTLISPFSETAVEDVTALMPTTSSAPTTDPQADQAAEIQARKSANRTDRRTRLDARRSAKQLRRHDGTDKVRLRPRLHVELQITHENAVPIEVVRATNHDDVNIVLTRIETIEGLNGGADLTTSQFTLSPGDSYLFVSGLTTVDAGSDEYRWLDHLICDDTTADQGYRLYAAFSPDAKNYEFTVRCDKASNARSTKSQAETSRPKRKRNNKQHKKKKR